MTAWYDFDESHVSYVTGSGESTNKVESIVEDARARREELLEAHAGDAFAADASDAHGEDEESTGNGEEEDETAETTLDDLGDTGDESDGDGDGGDTTDGDGRDDGQSGLFDFT
jgi:replication factor C large subunit